MWWVRSATELPGSTTQDRVTCHPPHHGGGQVTGGWDTGCQQGQSQAGAVATAAAVPKQAQEIMMLSISESAAPQ